MSSEREWSWLRSLEQTASSVEGMCGPIDILAAHSRDPWVSTISFFYLCALLEVVLRRVWDLFFVVFCCFFLRPNTARSNGCQVEDTEKEEEKSQGRNKKSEEKENVDIF